MPIPFHEYALSSTTDGFNDGEHEMHPAIPALVHTDMSSPNRVFVGYLTFRLPIDAVAVPSAHAPESFSRLCWTASDNH